MLKMAEIESLKNMVMTFRVSELQTLLGFAGRNKSGRKTELQARAIELLRIRSPPVETKVKELYKTIHQAHASGATVQQPSKEMPRSRSVTTRHQSASQQNMQSGTVQQPPNQQTTTSASIQSQPNQQSVLAPNIQPPPNQQISNMFPAPAYQSDRAVLPPAPGIFAPNIYHHAPYQAKSSPPVPYSFPVHPDVKLKRLPFFDFMGELLKPSTLLPQGTQPSQEGNFVFHLTPQQATNIASSRELRPGCKMEYVIQVQMRFSLIETSCEQEDCYPPGVAVKVNGKACPLPNPIPTNKPGVEPKRPPRPLNITPMVRLSPTVANHVNVQWSLQYGKVYCVAIDLVRKLTSSDLLLRLKQKGSRHPDYTRGLIKEKLQEDKESEIATTSLRVSLLCPLGKMRMTTPCRPATCSHLQCFDASVYLMMNERKPTWMCPVCDKAAIYGTLVIDGYFQEVLDSSFLSGSNEIQLHQDGSWTPLFHFKRESENMSESCVKIEADDDCIISDPSKEEQRELPKTEPTLIDLCDSDSDDGSDSVKEVDLGGVINV